MVRSALIAVILGLLGLSGTAQTSDELPSIPLQGVAAMVGDDPISYTDLRNRVRLLLAGVQVQPTQEILQQLAVQALDQLIEEKLKIQHARDFDFELPDEAVQSSVEQLAARSGASREQLYSEFLAEGINPISLEEQIRADVTWRQIMNGRWGSRIRVSQDQVDDKLEQILEGVQRKQFLLSEIFLAAPDQQTMQQAVAASRQLISQIEQGAPFPEVARQISFSSTRALGGDMGWLPLDTLEPEISTALADVSEPGVYGPILARGGVYIMAVRSIQEPDPNPKESVSLFQIFSEDGAEESLTDLGDRIEDCDDAASVVDRSSDLTGLNIGTIMFDDLSAYVQTSLNAVETGVPTEIINVRRGPSVLVVCQRRIESDAIPSREEIREQLRNEELAMISERELRNLERRSVIIRR